jgi:hypothetical protein
VIFAVLGVIVALVTIGYYVQREAEKPAALTPEETVNRFLGAVFLSADPQNVAAAVCSNWGPAEAITRTTSAVPQGAHVSWSELKVVTSTEDRVTVRGVLGIRLADDSRPSSFAQWRFTLVDEDGWRVCEARPLGA